MKTFFALAIFAVTLTASALEMTASLDFSNVYGGTNAGIYKMDVAFTPKTTLSESKLSFNTHQDDGQYTCTTSANFEIGAMKLTLLNVITGETTIINEKIFAAVSKFVDGQDCDKNITDLAGNQSLYSQTGPKLPIILNVTPPFDYKSVGVYLSPFNGYLYLDAELQADGDKLVLNPSQLLTKNSILSANSNHLSVTYYVFASKTATTLSLATGLVELK